MSKYEGKHTAKIEDSKSIILDKSLRFSDLKETKNANAFIIGTTFLLVVREIYC